jgi:hypothetical protein
VADLTKSLETPRSLGAGLFRILVSFGASWADSRAGTTRPPLRQCQRRLGCSAPASRVVSFAPVRPEAAAGAVSR